ARRVMDPQALVLQTAIAAVARERLDTCVDYFQVGRAVSGLQAADVRNHQRFDSRRVVLHGQGVAALGQTPQRAVVTVRVTVLYVDNQQRRIPCGQVRFGQTRVATTDLFLVLHAGRPPSSARPSRGTPDGQCSPRGVDAES